MALSFYTAGKIWHADKFQHLRDNVGLPVRARWIDLKEDDPIVLNEKGKLWQMCLEDVRDSNYVFLYSGAIDEEQRGALVEVGMALSLGKRVYAYGKCKSIQASPISDAAFTHHPLWHWIDAENYVKASYYALATEIAILNKERAARNAG